MHNLKLKILGCDNDLSSLLPVVIQPEFRYFPGTTRQHHHSQQIKRSKTLQERKTYKMGSTHSGNFILEQYDPSSQLETPKGVVFLISSSNLLYRVSGSKASLATSFLASSSSSALRDN
jgi:hypothetical protein